MILQTHKAILNKFMKTIQIKIFQKWYFQIDRRICTQILCTIKSLFPNEKNDKIKSYKCVSCDYEWNESNCVVKHVLKNKEVYFCLNCDDWVKDKSRVLDKGWSLFDMAGNLNQFV